MKTGRRVWQCELSMIDTAILIAGVLTSGTYFSAPVDDEREIRELARFLYERVEWPWATADGPAVRMGWKSGAGFLSYGWEGYSEAMLLYILGLGSPTHPLPAASYGALCGTYQWENLYDIDFLFAAPLFIHQLSHVWIDLRGIQDAFMREKRSDYFENSRRATAVQQQYAMRNPLWFKGYGENCWGVTSAPASRSSVRTEASSGSSTGTWPVGFRSDRMMERWHPGRPPRPCPLRRKPSWQRSGTSGRRIRRASARTGS
jgi:hypothetical protein